MLKTILLTLTLGLSLAAQAKITEIHDFKEMGPIVDGPGTVVIFDIDNTLLRPPQTLGSDQWFGDRVASYEAQGAGPLAKDFAIDDWIQVQLKTRMIPVQADGPAYVAKLQKRGIPVMALTARPSDLAFRTEEQLSANGYDLRRTSPALKNGFLEPHVVYLNGVLLVGPKNNKGTKLVSFLRGLGPFPRRIVFIDDKIKNVQNVEAALQGTGIEFEGFRYGAADAIVKSYNRELANRQHAHFLKTHELIPDDVAQ